MTHVSAVAALLVLTLLFTHGSFTHGSITHGSITHGSFFCLWAKPVLDGGVHHTFLRGAPPRLYHTWTLPPHGPRGCSFTDNPAVIREYRGLCQDQPGLHHQVMPESERVLQVEQTCVSVDPPQTTVPQEEEGHRVRRSPGAGGDGGSKVMARSRVKRGFIVPGTLWCGSGNKAPSYSDLGVFSETDKCCREHDQCQNTILSFHSKFGVFNSNIFTMSHCDCDSRFLRCLKGVGSSISDVVGYTFFNLLKMNCFTFSHRLQCSQRNWFGMCKESKMSLYAEVHPPTVYVTDSADQNSSSSSSTSSTFTSSSSTSWTSAPATVEPSGSPSPPDASGETQCRVFKYLDKCGNRILPQQQKYSLLNNHSRTMYHCDCTDRLLQSFPSDVAPTVAHFVMSQLVSRSCFVFHNCKHQQNCSEAAVRAQTLPQMEEWRPLQVKRLRARAGLQRLCVRLTRKHQ